MFKEIRFPLGEVKAALSAVAKLPINPEVESFFQGELKYGEVLVWSSAPAAMRLAKEGWPACGCGIVMMLFGGVFVFGTAAMFQKGDVIGTLIGLFVVFVGCWTVSSPYWFGRKAKRMGYFITNRRAVLITGNAFGEYRVRSFYPRNLQSLERVQLKDGSGDVIFERFANSESEGSRNIVEVAFYGVPDVREVEALLTELAESEKAS